MEICPCDSGKSYSECCERFILKNEIPKTPEELMRSRYTAYTQVNLDYIAKTMKGPALHDFDKEHAEQWSNQIKWQSLKIIRAMQEDIRGGVEFIARYSHNGNNDVIYEISEFMLEDGVWYYIDGATPKIGRNDTCPCGSQKKHKKCCGC
jgi:SEC-C motif-containing protein